MQPMLNSFYVMHGVLIGTILRDLARGFQLASTERPYRLKPFYVGAWKPRTCQ
jgi:hypothetical protein